jgi:hypothetical protein
VQTDTGNKRLFLRAANERIRLVNERFAVTDGNVRIFCECGGSECLQLLQVPVNVYDEVRVSNRLFVARPGHVQPGRQERITQSTKTYVVVKSHPRAHRLPLPAAPAVGSAQDGVR